MGLGFLRKLRDTATRFGNKVSNIANHIVKNKDKIEQGMNIIAPKHTKTVTTVIDKIKPILK